MKRCSVIYVTGERVAQYKLERTFYLFTLITVSITKILILTVINIIIHPSLPLTLSLSLSYHHHHHYRYRHHYHSKKTTFPLKPAGGGEGSARKNAKEK